MDNETNINETMPVQAEEQGTEQVPAPKEEKSKRQLRKEKKRAKKLARKQLRRDVRQRKRDEFRAKGCLGKLFWCFGKVVSFIVAILLIATVVQVNFGPVGRFVMSMYVRIASYVDMDSVTQEQVAQKLPVDEENAAAIDASAPIGEGETWAIYMYMVGSDLESSSFDQLSDATKYYTSISAENTAEENRQNNRKKLTGFMQDIMAQGMDLPLFFYKKNVTQQVPTWLMNSLTEILSFDREEMHMASMDIDEMMSVDLPENVKVVFQPGGAGKWGYDKINPNRTQRFVYDHEGIREVYNAQITSMARPETLSDFLSYCMKEHPADHTMVLFWNHGGGAFGYGSDNIFGGDMLSLADMREAFESVCEPDENNPPFDIIGFDACLMASMEVASTFNGFAHYLLGSEDTEPGYGWDYTAWLGALAENPRMNALQLGKAITDSYLNYYTKYAIANGSQSAELFSVIDLSKADDLEAAYGRLMASALKDSAVFPNTAALLGRCANSSIKYAGNTHHIYNTLDLGLFMQETAEFYPEESGEVLKIVDEMVLYNLAGGVHKESSGITVYYPSTITSIDGILMALKYIDDITDNEDIRALYYYKVAGCLREEMQAYVQEQGYGEIEPMDNTKLKEMTNAQITIGENQNYTAKTGEDVLEMSQIVEYNLIRVMGDGTARRLGSDSFVGVNDEGDLFTDFEGEWLHIDGKPVQVELLNATGNMITCSTKIYHQMEAAYLLLGFDMDEEKWEILGIQKNAQDANTILASRYTQALEPGDTITLVYETYQMDTGVGSDEAQESITYTVNTKVEDRALEDGEYISFITLTDARGDEYNLPTVSFEMKGGEMRNAQVGESYNMMGI